VGGGGVVYLIRSLHSLTDVGGQRKIPGYQDPWPAAAG
jgi:hypothetical protein